MTGGVYGSGSDGEGMGEHTSIDGSWPAEELIVWIPAGCEVKPMVEHKESIEDAGGDK